MDEPLGPPLERPRVRGDCADGIRPCPWISCRHHLMLDIDARGNLQVNADDIDEMAETCSLDVADRAEQVHLEVIAGYFRLTREGVRQIELRGMAELRAWKGARLREFGEETPIPPRRLPIMKEAPMPPVAVPRAAPTPVVQPAAPPPAPQPPRRESLADRANRLRKPLQDAASGPLVIAGEVMAIIENWADYKDEAGGIEASAWVRQTFGRHVNVPWFARRRAAVQAIGEHARRVWHHEAAVWASEHLSAEELRAVDAAVLRSTKSNGGVPLVRSTVQRLASKQAKVDRIRKAPRTCASCAALKARCLLLEEALRASGIAPPIMPEHECALASERGDATAQHVERAVKAEV